MKTCGGVEVIDPTFLISARHGDEWLATRPGRFTPGTNWIGGWVGLRGGLDTDGEDKILVSLPGIKPRRSCTYLVAIPTELSCSKVHQV
jgi:hypothetical protein